MSDPRQEPPIVRLATAARVTGSERGFTGIIAARVQSNLGFRVAGKIVERLVNVGQQVKAGQPLMRIDETDLRLALTAKRNAVAAARASVVQLDADERRYASLVSNGWASRQRYEQAKAASDTARRSSPPPKPKRGSPRTRRPIPSCWRTRTERWSKRLASRDRSSPPARRRSACPGRPPRSSGRASRDDPAGDRLGGRGQRVWGDGRRYTAHLRQLSDSADAQTRTYEARYVLDGEAAAAPLGATVTIRLASQASQPEVQVPLGAVLDDGRKTGVWVLDSATSTVHFRPVKLVRVTGETAVISGLSSGDPIVSLGAHLLQEGARVRTASESRGN